MKKFGIILNDYIYETIKSKKDKELFKKELSKARKELENAKKNRNK